MGYYRLELSNEAWAAHLLCLSHNDLSSSVTLAFTPAPQTPLCLLFLRHSSKLGQPSGCLTFKLSCSVPHRTRPAHKIWDPHWLGGLSFQCISCSCLHLGAESSSRCSNDGFRGDVFVFCVLNACLTETGFPRVHLADSENSGAPHTPTALPDCEMQACRLQGWLGTLRAVATRQQPLAWTTGGENCPLFFFCLCNKIKQIH